MAEIGLNGYLEKLASLLTVDESRMYYLANDFALIREYLFDILAASPGIGRLLVFPEYICKQNFDCSIVLDLSRILRLVATYTEFPACISLLKRGIREDIAHMMGTAFFTWGHQMPGGSLTTLLRELIAKGLEQNGYFVRGHKGDIYELDVLEDNFKFAGNWMAHEQQNNYIVVAAATDNVTLSIHFRLLIKFHPNDVPEGVMPLPTHKWKLNCLAAADLHGMCLFSLCAPLSENELRTQPALCIAMRLLLNVFQKMELYALRKIYLLSVCYELVYNMARQQKVNDPCAITDNIIIILRRMIVYFDRDKFPNYWNRKENLLKLFTNVQTKRYVHQCLRGLLQSIQGLRHSDNLTYDEVENFFGIQISTQKINIDYIGIYRSFTR